MKTNAVNSLQCVFICMIKVDLVRLFFFRNTAHDLGSWYLYSNTLLDGSVILSVRSL